MENEEYNGAIDNQDEIAKAKNYKLSEVCLAPASVIWLEKSQDQWKKLPTIRNQNGSGSCVCATYATELAILFEQKYGVWVDFSSTFPYQMRSKPMISGCNSTDIYSIFPKLGSLFETYMPSMLMSDAQMMAVKKEKYYDDLAKTFKVARIELPLSFETVASTIQSTGKGVMIWVKFHPEEWTDKPTVGTKPPTSGHSICAIDYFLVDGKKYIWIIDSWGKNYAIQGYRLISEEYFNARCFLASYLKTFETQDNEIQPLGKPKFDGSIVSAQKCWKWLGLFPANVPEIENMGPISIAACIKFQKLFSIEPSVGILGPKTSAKLLEMFS